MLLSSSIHAQSSSWTGALGISSQLVDRGLAITPATPSLQGTVSWASPTGWSLGLSSSAELNSGHVSETVLRATRYWSVTDDWQLQATALYYDYADGARTRLPDRTEAGVYWTYRDVLSFGVSAMRYTGIPNHSLAGAADLNFHWPLFSHLAFSAGAGVAQSPLGYYGVHGHPYMGWRSNKDLSFYRYGQAGLLWSQGAWHAELDRVAVDTGAHQQAGNLRLSPWLFSVSWSF